MKIKNSAGVQRAAIGLGVAALNASSHASVFYVNFPDVTIGPDPDGYFDNFLAGGVTFNFTSPSITAQPGFGGTATFFAFDNFAKKNKAFPSVRNASGIGAFLSQNLLAFGSSIDGSTVWGGGSTLPANLTDAYTGVRVETSPGSGSYRYGWIRFSTGLAASPSNFDGPVPGPVVNTDGLASTITLLDAAFETEPNTAILAVPEVSGSASMAFLGLAGGVMAFRRHRAQKR